MGRNLSVFLVNESEFLTKLNAHHLCTCVRCRVVYLDIRTYLYALSVDAGSVARSIADVALSFATRTHQTYNETSPSVYGLPCHASTQTHSFINTQYNFNRYRELTKLSI